MVEETARQGVQKDKSIKGSAKGETALEGMQKDEQHEEGRTEGETARNGIEKRNSIRGY